MPDFYQISKKEMEFLTAEANRWKEEKIITDEEAEDILALYEIKKSSLRMILFTAGCVLLGLGAVSFIAARWHEIPKIIRVCIIVGSHFASVIAYCLTGRSETKTGRSFLLLAGVILGSGIYLITRMYNYKLEWSTILGIWGLCIMLTALMTHDIWQVYFSQAIVLIYLIVINAVDIFALEFLNTARLSLSEFFSPVNAFALIAALWVLWRIITDRIAFNINLALTILLLASRMSLCFGGTWTLIILAITGALMSFLSKWHDTETAGLLMLGVFGLLLTWPDFWRGAMFSGSFMGFEAKTFWPVINALIVAVLMLVNIYRGHGAICVVFCALLASRYFFDHLFGYMPKAWGFTLTGIIFLAAALFFGRIRKFFIKEQAAEQEPEQAEQETQQE